MRAVQVRLFVFRGSIGPSTEGRQEKNAKCSRVFRTTSICSGDLPDPHKHWVILHLGDVASSVFRSLAQISTAHGGVKRARNNLGSDASADP